MKHITQSNPVVVVPVHRPQPTPDEQFSLGRCGHILCSHPIRIVHPAGLNLKAYQELLPTAQPLPVPAPWMASIRAYNRMMLNPAFYSKLSGFTHALIHEPDALVLSDQLHYWCKQPFGYIGAPWFDGYSDAAQDAPIIGVGNSGFSLIRLPDLRRAFESNYRWFSRPAVLKEVIKKLLNRPCCYSPVFLAKVFGSAGLLRGAHKVSSDNCDIFLSIHLAAALPDSFGIADPQNAIHFAWEVNPESCAELCKGLAPFGIHAWARYNKEFILGLIDAVGPQHGHASIELKPSFEDLK